MDLKTFLDHFDTIAQAPNGIAKLRSLILDLAVRGKLVPQNPEDEPAIQSLKRMQQEKATVIQTEGFRAKNNKKAVENKEYKISFPLPEKWMLAELDDLCIFIDYRGQTPVKVKSGIRLITAKNVRDGFIKIDPEEFISEETYHAWMTRGFPKLGDVLFTTEAPLGKAAVVDMEERFALAQRIINLRPLNDVYGYFLMWLILSPWFQNELQDRATGMTATGIKAAKLKLIRIPLPPLAEQKRIVEKVDELMALCDRLQQSQETQNNLRQKLRESAIASLTNAETDEELQKSWAIARDNWHSLSQKPEDVNDLRRSVLQLAVRGRLGTSKSEDIPASDLLKKIKREKDKLIKNKQIKAEKVLPEIQESGISFQLPQGWQWCYISDIARKVTDGEHLTPKRSPDGYYLLSARNVRDEGITLDDVDYVPEDEFFRIRKRCDPDKGDVLISCSGSIGRVAIVDRDETYVMVRSAALIKPFQDYVVSEFLAYALRSALVQNQIIEKRL